MGRIKGTIVKRSSKDLILYNKEKFGTDFAENKKAINQILPEVDKKLVNSMAGYITRLVKREQKK
jgi:small subunit ribosomal protein S17e